MNELPDNHFRGLNKAPTMPTDDNQVASQSARVDEPNIFDSLPLVNVVSDEHLTASVMAIDPKIGGPDLAELARILVSAWRGVPSDNGTLDDILPGEHRTAYNDAVERIRPLLTKLVMASKDLTPDLLGIEGVATAQHPWAADIDHVIAAALLQRFRIPGLTSTQSAIQVATAARLLVGTVVAAAIKGPPGRPRTMHEAHMIIRVSCVYRSRFNLPIDPLWQSHRLEEAAANSARSDREVTPVSETARLAVALRDALKGALVTEVRNASLEAAHVAFVKRHPDGLGKSQWSDEIEQ